MYEIRVTPGAVEFYLPAGSCFSAGSGSDLHIFSGYQLNWVSLYEPISNGCANTLGAMSNSAYIGLVYCPGASLAITSQYTFEAAGVGGVIADTISFTGALPNVAYSSIYAPVPPASRITN